MIPLVIGDGGVSNCKAQLHEREDECGLVVYTKNRYRATPQFLPLLNTDYGNALNQDASAGGTPVNIHNGTDNAYWTGNSISGTAIDFSSTNRAYSGTQSVRANSPNLGTVWEFDKGSTQALSGYVTLTFQINVNRRWTAGDSISIYGYDGAAQVGTKVFLQDYFDETVYDVWQAVTIPLGDMSLSLATIEAFRLEVEAIDAQSPDFFMDVIQLQETGDPIEFRTSHNPDLQYQATSFVITMVDNIAGTLADAGGMLPLSYDKFLGVSALSTGITIRSVYNGQIDFSGNVTGLMDLLAVGFHVSNAGTDGTNTFITLTSEFKEPLILDGDPSGNYISMTINDDLSGLVRFTAALRGHYVDLRS